MPISRETARKRTALAQIGSAVLLVGAAGAAVVSIPTPKPDEPSAPELTDGPSNPPTEGPVDLDTLGLASTLDASGIIRVEPEKPDVPKPDTEVAGTGPKPDHEPVVPGEWKFLGSIVGPRQTHAMVSIDGKQKLLAPGAEVGEIKIVAVSAEELTVEEKGATRKIKLAAKVSSWPTGNAARSPRPNIAGVPPPPPPPGPNPEMEAERQERERMLMEEEAARAKQGVAGGANGAPMRPAPLPTDAAPGKGRPVKGMGGAGNRH